MAGAALGIVGNQAVAFYKRRVGTRIGSLTLLADAKHSWLDAVSSLGALAGLALVAAGYRWGDPVAGFAVTAFICHVGYEVTKDMIVRLMDGIDPGDLDAAEQAALAVTGVRSATVRGRWMGRRLLLDVQSELDGSLSLAAAGQVARQVEGAVAGAVPAASEVRCDARPWLAACPGPACRRGLARPDGAACSVSGWSRAMLVLGRETGGITHV
jgi:cation diffusion facilitator family transporter